MPTESKESAADLAATAALLEIAENLGLSPLLDGGVPFSLDEVTAAAALPEPGATAFLEALVAAGLLQHSLSGRRFEPVADLADRRYEAGYLSWSLTANRPYIDHAAEFLRDADAAGARYQREGRAVAVSSGWIGSYGFYPEVIAEITGRKPQRIADLGSGAGGLLMQVLTALPNSTGVALDRSMGACAEAQKAAERANVHDRLEVVAASIESLVDDPGPILDADVVHAGFVLHDVVSRPQVLDRIVRTIRVSLAEDGCFAVTDAVPYVANERERAFSALFSYLHTSSMAVRLPAEARWRDLFARAGFSDVTAVPLRMPGARLFVATG